MRLGGKGLQLNNPLKNEKTRKKVSFFLEPPPFFLPKQVVFRRVRLEVVHLVMVKRHKPVPSLFSVG
jgi:hypothetical protein